MPKAYGYIDNDWVAVAGPAAVRRAYPQSSACTRFVIFRLQGPTGNGRSMGGLHDARKGAHVTLIVGQMPYQVGSSYLRGTHDNATEALPNTQPLKGPPYDGLGGF